MHILHIYRTVNTFEDIALNLVQQPNFTELTSDMDRVQIEISMVGMLLFACIVIYCNLLFKTDGRRRQQMYTTYVLPIGNSEFSYTAIVVFYLSGSGMNHSCYQSSS